jgi:hypothetical protein
MSRSDCFERSPTDASEPLHSVPHAKPCSQWHLASQQWKVVLDKLQIPMSIEITLEEVWSNDVMSQDPAPHIDTLLLY